MSELRSLRAAPSVMEATTSSITTSDVIEPLHKQMERMLDIAPGRLNSDVQSRCALATLGFQYHDWLRDALKHVSGDVANFRCLDLAAGLANASIFFASTFGHYCVAIEGHEVIAAEAHKRVQAAGLEGRVSVVVGDARNPPTSHLFDLVIASSVGDIFGPLPELLNFVGASVALGGHLLVLSTRGIEVSHGVRSELKVIEQVDLEMPDGFKLAYFADEAHGAFELDDLVYERWETTILARRSLVDG